jgi:membrane associated rhomboid family serine protease
MPAWTEEAAVPATPEAVAAVERDAVSIAGVPYVTILTLVACGWVLAAAGGVKESLPLSALLAFGAKATPLMLDRGETWRLFAANFLHKDILHLAFNAFAIWNVGGALERAVRPQDYIALIIATALGTTVVSALGADSISLGASGIAFGVLGAAATFGWRRGVRGHLRSYFGLRIVPWMLALFAAGVGSSGVDNWGHAGGLLVGTAMGGFLAPRTWPGDAAARRLATAIGALAATLFAGVIAGPLLPILGSTRAGTSTASVEMPIGWRRVIGEPRDRSVFANGLTGPFRSSAAVVQTPACTGKACDCDRVVAKLLDAGAWRNADLGPMRKLQMGEPVALGQGRSRVDGSLTAEDGVSDVNAVCVDRPQGQLAILILQPPGGSTTLVERMADTVR